MPRDLLRPAHQRQQPAASFDSEAAARREKIYCDKWIRDGTCAFTQYGQRCPQGHIASIRHSQNPNRSWPRWGHPHGQRLLRQQASPGWPSPVRGPAADGAALTDMGERIVCQAIKRKRAPIEPSSQEAHQDPAGAGLFWDRGPSPLSTTGLRPALAMEARFAGHLCSTLPQAASNKLTHSQQCLSLRTTTVSPTDRLRSTVAAWAQRRPTKTVSRTDVLRSAAAIWAQRRPSLCYSHLGFSGWTDCGQRVCSYSLVSSIITDSF